MFDKNTRFFILLVFGGLTLLIMMNACSHFVSRDDEDNGFVIKVYRIKNHTDRTPAESRSR